MSDVVVPAKLRLPGLWRDAIAVGVILLVAIAGYLLFPNNLALLTRIVAVMLLVLSLDLVTGFAGIATLGHAALFGAGAYGAGIAAAKFGIADPLVMLAIGAVVGALAGTLSSLVILRGTGLAQLVLSIAVAQLAHEAANKLSAWTGGSDGLSGIAPTALFGLYRFDLWGRTAFFMAIVLLVLVFVVLRIIVRS
ncbi:MAG TPA: branched-chain amino acid ABC transporter permease, partial [Devosia sp.]|nr:branched-chain amino acid ABC transporter permease [Devosia sp.]